MTENKTRQIKVRGVHISTGKCRDPNHCILKLAIAGDYRHRGYEVLRLSVKGNGAVATTQKKGVVFSEKWMIPDKAYKMLRTFDKCEKRIEAAPAGHQYAVVAAAGVHPFEFIMRRAEIKRSKPLTQEEKAQKSLYRKKRIAHFKRTGEPIPPGYLGLSQGTAERLDSVLTGVSLQ